MSTFTDQAQASIDQIDLEAAQKHLEAMNLPKAPPTLTSASQMQPPSPEKRYTSMADALEPCPDCGSIHHHSCEGKKAARKRRSDAGLPKKPPSSADEITLRVTVDVARSMASALTETFPSMSTLIQDQIIQQLQKKIDSLQKQK